MIDSRRGKLRCYMNWLALDGLPPFAGGPLRGLQDAGYDGVQLIEPFSLALVEEARGVGLGVCGSGRIHQAADAERIARQAVEMGLECVTLHVGWGMEDDDEADRLIAAILEAAARHRVLLFPETHRATIFQDIWRTVQFVQRFPELRFNCDFSHWYTGLEMVYGGFERKVEFINPVIERGRFLHGRIGNPGCMQVDIGDADPRDHPYVAHFRLLWMKVFTSFLRQAAPEEVIWFTPELLSHQIYYARVFAGKEESDRWQQSKVLVRIAMECFEQAQELRLRPECTT